MFLSGSQVKIWVHSSIKFDHSSTCACFTFLFSWLGNKSSSAPLAGLQCPCSLQYSVSSKHIWSHFCFCCSLAFFVPQNKQRRLHPLSWPMLCFVAAHLNSRWLHGIWLMLICTVLFIYNTLINKVIHSWGASQSWEEETKDCHDVEQWQNSHCSSLSSIASLKQEVAMIAKLNASIMKQRQLMPQTCNCMVRGLTKLERMLALVKELSLICFSFCLLPSMCWH